MGGERQSRGDANSNPLTSLGSLRWVRAWAAAERAEGSGSRSMRRRRDPGTSGWAAPAALTSAPTRRRRGRRPTTSAPPSNEPTTPEALGYVALNDPTKRPCRGYTAHAIAVAALVVAHNIHAVDNYFRAKDGLVDPKNKKRKRAPRRDNNDIIHNVAKQQDGRKAA